MGLYRVRRDAPTPVPIKAILARLGPQAPGAAPSALEARHAKRSEDPYICSMFAF
jgi:hypothetical protein